MCADWKKKKLKQIREVKLKQIRTDLLCEGHDDVAEVAEALVDGLGLGEPQPLAPAVLDPLAARQVHLRISRVR